MMVRTLVGSNSADDGLHNKALYEPSKQQCGLPVSSSLLLTILSYELLEASSACHTDHTEQSYHLNSL
jgi:hypothetical protein